MQDAAHKKDITDENGGKQYGKGTNSRKIGGGNSLGLQKLWEGDVQLTGSTDDLTSGAVDPSKYCLLIVHCAGTITALDKSLHIGVGSSNGTSSSIGYDVTVTKKASGEAQLVAITMPLRKICDTATDVWYGDHIRSLQGKQQFFTEVPFSLTGCYDTAYAQNTFTGDLHVVVYGIKQ